MFSLLIHGKKLFLGTGTEKSVEVLNDGKSEFNTEILTSAKNMLELSYQKYIKNDFEDVAYFEPFYLKDFVATVPKKNIFK